MGMLMDAPPLDDVVGFGGRGYGPRETRNRGDRVSAGTGTGPMATPVSGTGARRALTEQLFAANYPKLAGWVRRLVDDDDTAHEIASEAFVRLLSKWTSIDKLDSPQSYLYII